MTQLVQRLEIASNRIRIGAITFSKQVKANFYLNQYFTKNEVQTALNKIEYMGEQTNTAGALEVRMILSLIINSISQRICKYL